MPSPKGKKMLTTIFLIFAVVIVGILGAAAMQPDQFSVERCITIDAPPSAIFEHVNNIHAWDAWSPWKELDVNAAYTFNGPDAGVGASNTWKGNNQIGEGTMTITESRPNEVVTFRLDFIKPMPGTSTARFTFTPEGNATRVTWSMEGKNNFMAKIFSLFMNCEKMVGGYFDKGLNSLKTRVERK